MPQLYVIRIKFRGRKNVILYGGIERTIKIGYCLPSDAQKSLA